MSSSIVGVAIVAGVTLAGWESFRLARTSANPLSELRHCALISSIPPIVLIVYVTFWYGVMGGSLYDLSVANVESSKTRAGVYLTYALLSAGASFSLAYVYCALRTRRRGA